MKFAFIKEHLGTFPVDGLLRGAGGQPLGLLRLAQAAGKRASRPPRGTGGEDQAGP